MTNGRSLSLPNWLVDRRLWHDQPKRQQHHAERKAEHREHACTSRPGSLQGSDVSAEDRLSCSDLLKSPLGMCANTSLTHGLAIGCMTDASFCCQCSLSRECNSTTRRSRRCEMLPCSRQAHAEAHSRCLLHSARCRSATQAMPRQQQEPTDSRRCPRRSYPLTRGTSTGRRSVVFAATVHAPWAQSCTPGHLEDGQYRHLDSAT